MAILAFQKPDKVLMLEADSKFGKFEFRPLEPGFGITVGNALRRILLSSLEGYAINTIHIEGVEHEFATVPGVKEDVTNIILNLKQVRFKQIVEEFEDEFFKKVVFVARRADAFAAGVKLADGYDGLESLTGVEIAHAGAVITQGVRCFHPQGLHQDVVIVAVLGVIGNQQIGKEVEQYGRRDNRWVFLRAVSEIADDFKRFCYIALGYGGNQLKIVVFLADANVFFHHLRSYGGTVGGNHFQFVYFLGE